MSIMAGVRDVVTEILSDGEKHTLQEITREVRKRGIDVPPKSTMVRTTLYNMMDKDKNIVSVGRGVYQLRRDASQAYKRTDNISNEELEQFVERLDPLLLNLNKLNWKLCSEETLNEKRKTVELLQKIKNKIKDGIK